MRRDGGCGWNKERPELDDMHAISWWMAPWRKYMTATRLELRGTGTRQVSSFAARIMESSPETFLAQMVTAEGCDLTSCIFLSAARNTPSFCPFTELKSVVSSILLGFGSAVFLFSFRFLCSSILVLLASFWRHLPFW